MSCILFSASVRQLHPEPTTPLSCSRTPAPTLRPSLVLPSLSSVSYFVSSSLHPHRSRRTTSSSFRHLLFVLALSSLFSVLWCPPTLADSPSLHSKAHLPSLVAIPAAGSHQPPPNRLISFIPAVVPEFDTTAKALGKRALVKYTFTTDNPPTPATTSKTAPKATPKSIMSNSTATATSSSLPSATVAPLAATVPSPTPLPDSPSDTALFGRPSVIAGYNLTAGILINGSFMLAFLIALGVATFKRAQFRKQFRRDIKRHGGSIEAGRASPSSGGGKTGGRGGSNAGNDVREKDSRDTSLSKQASISRRALMDDVGPGGMQASSETNRTRIAEANRAVLRSYDDRADERRQEPRGGTGIRFGETNDQSAQSGARSEGLKYQTSRADRSNETRVDAQAQDPLVRYQDEPDDTNDYTLPPLTASPTEGAYYAGGLINAYESYPSPQVQPPRPTYQQQPPRPLQPIIKRSNSNRMPTAPASTNGYSSQSSSQTSSPVERGPSPTSSKPRIATQGLVERAGSGQSSRSPSSSGSNSSSPTDRYNGRSGRGASPIEPIEMENYPMPIGRSSSTRLPREMRGGANQPYAPSGLGQSQARSNNYV